MTADPLGRRMTLTARPVFDAGTCVKRQRKTQILVLFVSSYPQNTVSAQALR